MKIFNLPDLGEGLAEAEIREWYVKVGDTVTVDQPLVSMETAKAVVDVPSPYAGKIVALHGNVNDIVNTGAPLIEFDVGGNKSAKDVNQSKQDKGSVVGKLESSEKKWDEGDVIIGAAKTGTATVKAMPAARVLAKEMHVDLTSVTPTGPKGLITVEDVKKRLAAHQQAREQHVIHGAEDLHGVRRVMAQAMAQSHAEVAAVTVFDDADITSLDKETDLTVAIIQAIISAVKAEPALNAWFDGYAKQRKLFDEVNLGIAVDSQEGLFVPVIKNAGTLSKEQLRKKVDAIKQGVKERSIPAADMQGATITLSNFGTIAGRYATPVIVPPAVAILACGKLREQPVIRDGKVAVGKVMPLSLTFDHRAATGGEATRFLAEVIKHLTKV